MILTVDVSNTSIIFSVVAEEKTILTFRLSSDKSRTSDEYAVLMELTAKQHNLDLHTVDGTIVSSVVPTLTSVIEDAVKIAAGHSPIVIGPGVKTGLNIRLDDPTELGGDFVSAAVAAIDKYPLPCVIVEMGTAIAMGILDASGNYIGGIICPGPKVSQIALARGAAQLSNVSITPTAQVIGKSTDTSMQSGLVHGAAAMIDGLIERIEDELGQPATVVVAGDWADTIIPHCKRKGMIIDKELLTRGMVMIYKKNKR